MGGLYVKRQNIHLSRTHVPAPYKINHDTAIDYSTAGWGHAVEALMHAAQRDVEEEHLPEVKKLFHPK